MSGAIAIFVKTPGRSAVKTRLASGPLGLGEVDARAWYLLAAMAVAAVARRAAADCNAQVYWAVAEADCLLHPMWRGLPTLAQGEGDLGARMGSVHSELVARHGSGVLLGADTPQLDPDSLRIALAWLPSGKLTLAPRLVIGPTEDGGFWLFGANQAVAMQHWQGVAYSQWDTAACFRAALAGYGEWLQLATHTDVDYPKDLLACAGALRQLVSPLPEQSALLSWMCRKEASGSAHAH